MNKPKATESPAPSTARHPCATPGCSALIARGCLVCVAHTVPPWRRLGACPTCGCAVMSLQWTLDAVGAWIPLPPLLTPMLGDPHDCTVALIQDASHWQYLVRVNEYQNAAWRRRLHSRPLEQCECGEILRSEQCMCPYPEAPHAPDSIRKSCRACHPSTQTEE